MTEPRSRLASWIGRARDLEPVRLSMMPPVAAWEYLGSPGISTLVGNGELHEWRSGRWWTVALDAKNVAHQRLPDGRWVVGFHA